MNTTMSIQELGRYALRAQASRGFDEVVAALYVVSTDLTLLGIEPVTHPYTRLLIIRLKLMLHNSGSFDFATTYKQVEETILGTNAPKTRNQASVRSVAG